MWFFIRGLVWWGVKICNFLHFANYYSYFCNEIILFIPFPKNVNRVLLRFRNNYNENRVILKIH